MADLDDFFAKKDKKKKTKKFPKANTDLLASKLEEIDRKEHQAEMKAVSAAMSAGESNFTKESHPEGKDEEWKEYEEFKKDYSGLKIETLKIDADNSPIGDDEETELNEDGEKVRVKKTDGGPWNKAGGHASGKNEEEHDSPPSSPEPHHHTESAPSGPPKSAYVPPHLRGSSGSSSSPSSSGPSSSSKSQQRRNKTAPDISNEFYFPTLSATVSDGPPVKGAERSSEAVFERVKSGGQQHAKSAEGPRLALDNKFAALRGDH